MMMSFIRSCRDKIGAELHISRIYLEEGTYQRGCLEGLALGGVFLLFILGSNLGGGRSVRGLQGGGRRGWCEE
jgi:hypothetical protein